MSEIHPLTHVLASAPVAEPLSDAAGWWRVHQANRQRWPRPIETSIAAGFAADRVAWAFASAYQSALRTLRPQLPDDAPASFCVTEAGGTGAQGYQTLVQTTASGVRLDGAKSWIASGPKHTVLLVLARSAAEPLEPAQLCVVQVDSRTPGVTLTPIEQPRLVPELPQSKGRFDAVDLPPEALLDGDGNKRYARSFRTLEAIQVNAAVTAMLLREGRARGWERRSLERAAALLASFLSLADADPLAASTEVTLAGALEGVAQWQGEADQLLESASDEFADRWRRDRKLLAGMLSARTQRAERAWQRLDGRGANPAH